MEDLNERNLAAIIRSEIMKTIENGQASSASIAVVDNTKITCSAAFGMTDRKNAVLADAKTQFNIGSVSKLFTTVAVLQLCELKKIDLDNPVTQYLQEFVMQDERYREITVRMLLNHTSGLPVALMLSKSVGLF